MNEWTLLALAKNGETFQMRGAPHDVEYFFNSLKNATPKHYSRLEVYHRNLPIKDQPTPIMVQEN